MNETMFLDGKHFCNMSLPCCIVLVQSRPSESHVYAGGIDLTPTVISPPWTIKKLTFINAATFFFQRSIFNTTTLCCCKFKFAEKVQVVNFLNCSILISILKLGS